LSAPGDIDQGNTRQLQIEYSAFPQKPELEPVPFQDRSRVYLEWLWKHFKGLPPPLIRSQLASLAIRNYKGTLISITSSARIMPHFAFVRPFVVIAILLIMSFDTLIAAPPEGYRFLTLTEATQVASRENRPMLLYFGRYGCTTCRKMHAEVFSDEAVSAKYNNAFVLAYVDTESGNRIRLGNGETTTEMQFAARHRILGTPTFIYFSAEQEPLFQKAGFQTIAQMNLYGDYILQNHYRSMPLQEFIARQ
jgi:thioredoxin-related protein